VKTGKEGEGPTDKKRSKRLFLCFFYFENSSIFLLLLNKESAFIWTFYDGFMALYKFFFIQKSLVKVFVIRKF
jgi:uncharacterized membrane protein YjjP (DUF1212 family)